MKRGLCDVILEHGCTPSTSLLARKHVTSISLVVPYSSRNKHFQRGLISPFTEAVEHLDQIPVRNVLQRGHSTKTLGLAEEFPNPPTKNHEVLGKLPPSLDLVTLLLQSFVAL